MRLSAVVLLVAASAAASQLLTPGTPLPPLQAKTLNGEQATLPQNAKGRPFLLVVGFSKAAADVTRPWLEACRSTANGQPSTSRVACYDVRMLGDVPWLFRGLVESGVSASARPTPIPPTSLPVTKTDACPPPQRARTSSRN